MQKEIKKILIVNPFGIGDVLFTTPLIESISGRIEGARIGFLCNRRTEPLLRANPKIEWVFVYEKDELKTLRKESRIGYIKKLFALVKDIREKKFDAAIDLSLNREYGFICWLAGIRERIGFNYKKRGSYLTKKIDISGYHDKHIVEYYLDLLRLVEIKSPQAHPPQRKTQLYLSPEEIEWARRFLEINRIGKDGLLIGIAPGGGASWGKDAAIKHWRSENFAEIADRLIEKMGAKVIVFGSTSEVAICENMVKAMRNPAIKAYGTATLLESAAVMCLCALFIANDGGALHIAVAAGTKTVGIFGPVDEKVYGQYPSSEKHKIVTGKVECRPCYKNFKLKSCDIRKCLDAITVEEVFEAAKEALKA